MKRLLPILFATLAMPAHAQSAPQTIPLTVRWQTIAPQAVSIVTPTGNRELVRDDSKKGFTGTVPVPDELVGTQTVLVEYDGQSFPLLLNVRKTMSSIEFLVDHDSVPSCANLYVRGVEQVADNMNDAMRRMLTAAYMLSFPPPDRDCAGDRRMRSVKARFDRNQNLATTSLGLFAISDDVRQALLQIPAGSLPGRVSGPALVAQADTDTNSALAKGLYADMLQTGSAKDYATAADIGARLSDAMTTRTDLAVGLQRQGITADRLKADTAYFETLAQSAGPQ